MLQRQNVRYCFPTGNRFTAAVGLWNMLWWYSFPTAKECITAVTDTQLVLHGGVYEQTFTDRPTWILDLTSYSWRLYTSQKDQLGSNHTATLGLNRNIIIIGGNNTRTGGVCDKIFHVMLEPKSLQKLSLYTVYKNQADLPWKGLPKKLLSVLGLFDKAQSYGDVSFRLCS